MNLNPSADSLLMRILNADFCLIIIEDISRWNLLPSCAALDNSAGCIHIGLTVIPDVKYGKCNILRHFFICFGI